MGLDIVAYSQLVELPVHDFDPEDCWGEGHVHISDPYAFKYSSFCPPDGGRCYLPNGEDDVVYYFRAGSYSGYGTFRARLCLAVHEVPIDEFWHHEDGYEGAPFFDLLNFSDCEGFLSTEACQRLFASFAEQNLERLAVEMVDIAELPQQRYDFEAKTYVPIPPDEAYQQEFEWYYQKLRDWQNAAQIGADNGTIVFG